jgi:hypothetical protein
MAMRCEMLANLDVYVQVHSANFEKICAQLRGNQNPLALRYMDAACLLSQRFYEANIDERMASDFTEALRESSCLKRFWFVDGNLI